VIARDKELDDEYAAGLRRLMTRAMEDPRQVSIALEAAFALKSLERIGDHARNLARQVQSIGGDSQPLPDTAMSGSAQREP
jgi:phosphate transport system protein